MEPAMILCAAVAATTLGLVAIGRAGQAIASIPDRLAHALVDVAPNRALATTLLALIGLAASPRSAGAEPMPPIVRLADEPVTADPPPRLAVSATYEVRLGDSLWCIAAGELERRFGRSPTGAEIAAFWPRIYAANEAVIGNDPNLILPGQQLRIP